MRDEKRIFLSVAVLVLVALFLAPPVAPAQDAAGKLARRPKIFATIFNMGYSSDQYPDNPEDFEKAVLAIKSGNYNVILCRWEDWRAEICKKHDMKIMLDMLVGEQHIYKNTEAAKKVCEKVKGNDVVYGYALWHDRGTNAGRDRDAKLIHSLDGTHPTYAGSYRLGGISGLTEQDLIGYYDFHWKRGHLWGDMQRVYGLAKEKDIYWMRYTGPDPGLVGHGNPNRVGYTVSVSIAFGLKGYLYHYRGGELNTSTWEWDALGKDLAKVNGEFAPLGPELMKIGLPTAIYSTPTTKTAKDRPTGQPEPTVPGGITPIPNDHWAQVTNGEAIMSMFTYPEKRDAIYLANHNCYQPQEMKLAFQPPVKTVAMFDRQTSQWRDLQLENNTASFTIPPFVGELIRIER